MTDPTNDAPNTANPYAPPATASVTSRTRHQYAALRSPWIWGYAGGELLAAVSDVAYYALGVGSNLYGLALRLLGMLVGLAWLGSAYERVPARFRTACAPGALIGRHFVPLYNIYWLFKAQNLLCDGLDMQLVASGRRANAPRGLAMAACGLGLASRLLTGLPGGVFAGFMLVRAGLWATYMLDVERTLAISYERDDRRVCAYCSHDNEADATFCITCRAKL